MSLTEPISLWQDKPDFKAIENLVAAILPQSVEYAGGICEAHGYAFELALPESTLDRVTPFIEHVSNEILHISLAHPLILNFADQVLGQAPIDIVELKPFKETPPQRVIEKVSALFSMRPSKIELIHQKLISRIWVHSLYLFGFEAAEIGNKLKHFLQDHRGTFLEQPESYLKRLHLRLGDYKALRHLNIPSELTFHFKDRAKTGVSEKAFEAEFKTEIARMQNEEMNKAIHYYDRLEEDIHKRMSQEKQKEGKLERIRTERNLRLGNIQERFRAQFHVQPVGARILILPTYRCRLQPNASSKAFINIDYCPMLREFLLPTCDVCKQTSRSWALKENKYLCPRCA